MNADRPRFTLGIAALAHLAALACGPAASTGDAETGSSDASNESSSTAPEPQTDVTDASSSASTSSSDSASESSEDGGASDGSTTSSGVEGVCGDGVLDPLEQCDDGDIVGGDGCESDCKLSNLEPWSYLGELFTSARALAVGPDGTVVVGGAWGNAWATGYYTPLLRTFAADGELLVETDALVAGEGFVNEVVQRPDGRFWLLGGRGSDAWIHRFDARDTDDIDYIAFDGIHSADLGTEHIAVGSRTAVAMLDIDSTELLWQQDIGWVDDVTLAGNGDLVTVGQVDFPDPVELRRFTPDGAEVGEPRTLTPLEQCTLGSSALGIVLACMQSVGDDLWSTELALYDDELTLVWSVSMPDRQVFSIEASDDEILVAGAYYGSGAGYVMPLGFRLDADGEETWSFTPDPTEFELTDGLLGDVARTPDGAVVFTGEMLDLDIDAVPPASYAYVVRAEL